VKILNSQQIGDGSKNVIILHGFLGMGDNWRGFAKKFDSRIFCFHLIDQRNHGKSFWDESMSYDDMARDLLLFCNSQNIHKSILIGHSMGGKTAMKFSLLFPERVEKLIIVDIAPKKYLPDFKNIIDGYNHLDLDSFNSRFEIDNVYKIFVEDNFLRSFLMKNIYRNKEGKFRFRINLKVLEKKIKEIGSFDHKNSFFNKQTEFIKGSKSDYILEEDKNLIKKYFPKYSLHKVNNAGHWVHYDKPEIFEKIVKSII
tara:strand:- start:3997 stop:4764 length:768 start_codon:yes stop_codon:yes gene_type:complete